MALKRPKSITQFELAQRKRRIAQIARRMGYIGRIEYRHVYSRTGGAQYGLARVANDDLLILYAEAFEKDADPLEFSLESMLAHECGHQMMHRDGRLQKLLPKNWTEPYEEILASVLGATLVESDKDSEELLLKAYFDSVKLGLDETLSRARIEELFKLFRSLL